MYSRETVRALVFAVFLGSIISGCGGNAPIMPAPTPTVPAPTPPAPTPAPPGSSDTQPVISNITANFSTDTCTRQADGHTARALVITFDYRDGSGDLSGGSVELHRVYNTGRSESHVSPIPSGVTLNGTPTAGVLTIPNACPLYDDATSSVETVDLVDANGSTSNTLSIATTRPAGDP